MTTKMQRLTMWGVGVVVLMVGFYVVAQATGLFADDEAPPKVDEVDEDVAAPTPTPFTLTKEEAKADQPWTGPELLEPSVTVDLHSASVVDDDPVAIASFQYRGGTDPCRFLYTGTTRSTLADFAIIVELKAWTDWRDADLSQTGEYALMGPTGPYTFTLKDSSGVTVLSIPVGKGETVREIIRLDDGIYTIHEPDIGQIGLLEARIYPSPGSPPVTQWHYDCGMAIIPDMER